MTTRDSQYHDFIAARAGAHVRRLPSMKERAVSRGFFGGVGDAVLVDGARRPGRLGSTVERPQRSEDERP